MSFTNIVGNESQKVEINVKLRLSVFLIFIFIIVASAWVCDDAYHAAVMAKHLVQGDGFVYNIGERVNASTCPLYTLIVAGVYAILPGNVWMYAICLIGTGILFSSLCAYILLWKFCRNNIEIILLAVLFCSSSFISYTTSGLENPLLFLLGILFITLMFREQSYTAAELFGLALLSALIAMTRMDNILIYLPFLIECFFIRKNQPGRGKTILIGLLGVVPFIAWELFSLVYYGFPFPNTAYIKLNTGISLKQYLMKGLEYVIVTLAADPAVVIIPVLYALMGGVLIKTRDRRHLLLSLGIFLYMLYVTRIGGDFMLGRHFTVIYVVSIAALILLLRDHQPGNMKNVMKNTVCTGILCMVYMATIGQTLGVQIQCTGRLSGIMWGKGGSADERAIYFPDTSLIVNAYTFIRTGALLLFDSTWNKVDVEQVQVSNKRRDILSSLAPGILVCLYSDLYLQDTYGLGDPLLSHLPALPVKGNYWRPGHIHRAIPEGYRKSVVNDDNEIVDSALHEYYDIIRFVIRGDLWDWNRLKTVIKLNLGGYNYLVQDYVNRNVPKIVR